MSYHRKSPRTERVALGDVAGAIATASQVVQDPYFNEVLCRINQLTAIERKQPIPNCTSTPDNIAGGVGLRKAMPALRAYIYAEKQPLKWPLIAAAAGVIGIPALIGYAIGKGGR